MSNLSQWSALVGFILPLVVAIVQQSHFSRLARTIIGAVSVVVSAVITALVQNNLNWNTWATSVIWIATTAFTAYRNIWVPLGAADWIEAVTSGRSIEHTKQVRKVRTGEHK